VGVVVVRRVYGKREMQREHAWALFIIPPFLPLLLLVVFFLSFFGAL